jgi:DNA-binding NtrC family response regulator
MNTILIVENDDSLRLKTHTFLEKKGYKVYDAADTATAALILDSISFDVIVGDVNVDEKKLLDLVHDYTDEYNQALVIIITDPDENRTEDQAVKDAAFDYLQKPFENSEIEYRIRKAVEFRQLHFEAQSLRGERNLIYRPENFIGESPAIKKVFTLVSKVAISDSSVLLTGETGTGKELIAGSIHYNSDRAGNAFIKVNCAALPDQLLESELFGHEKGSFTGAHQRRIGRFEQADGGSIFLDEVADMSQQTQAKVLRVIQEKEFERIGGGKTIKTDVRIISATNKDLPEEIAAGKFRQDLYYRLNVISIRIPPLRDRSEDVVPLAKYFVKKFSADLKKKVKNIHPLAVELLKEHSFPGNVRELQNIIERAVLMSEDDEITVEDLDLTFKSKNKGENANIITISPDGFDLHEIEKGYIIQALKICGWVQKEAAKLLNISPRSLNYKIKKHGISHQSWKEHGDKR